MKRTRRFEESLALQSKLESRKRTPDYLGNMFVIFGIALSAGLVVLVGVRLVTWALSWDAWVHKLMAGLAILGTLAWWSWRAFRDSLILTIEETFYADMNNDGQIGVSHNYEVHTGPTRQVRVIGPPPEVLLEWADAAVNGGSLAYRLWAPRFTTPGRNDGVEMYSRWRSGLVRMGYAEEKGTHSISLTEEGIRFFSGVLEAGIEDPTPLLEGLGRKMLPG